MHPRLHSSTTLRTSSRVRVPWVNISGVALLLLILVSIPVIRAHTESSGLIPAGAKLSVSYIKGTQVPVPPRAYGMKQDVARPGKDAFVPGPGGLTPANSNRLFDFYLRAMIAGGWTLGTKSDPGAGGEWSLLWLKQNQTSVLSLFTSPKTTLTVNLCPPQPYC
ncbi:MAG: hypothetical protein QOH48_811 [Actinomycetota bacterium]|jgi:hypothetical protein|nr:hypothetical protein [Actinomycetota bacterium]